MTHRMNRIPVLEVLYLAAIVVGLVAASGLQMLLVVPVAVGLAARRFRGSGASRAARPVRVAGA
jgi:hypothetical protein